MFPGQGTQYPGMCNDLLHNFPNQTKPILEEVDESLKFHLSKLMLEGPEEDLNLTQNAQPAIVAASTMVAAVLKDSLGIEIPSFATCVLGHSVGEFSALHVADSLTLDEAVQATHHRGIAMQNSCKDPFSMVQLFPVQLPKLLTSIENAERLTGLKCNIAAINSPNQISICGDLSCVNAVIEYYKKNFERIKATPLRVSAPFHSCLLTPAIPEILGIMVKPKWKAPSVTFISNATAEEVKNTDTIARHLVAQTIQPVRWADCVTYAISHCGVTNFLELGARGTLSNLVQRINPNVECLSLETTAGIKELEKALS